MSESIIKLPELTGFNQVKTTAGISIISFISKPGISNEYSIGETTKITGVCSYQFLSSAGIIRGILISSPKAHTVLTPLLVKIGPCPGPFYVNYNLQQLGILWYESPDSSVLLIPVDVKSPLLVEVNV